MSKVPSESRICASSLTRSYLCLAAVGSECQPRTLRQRELVTVLVGLCSQSVRSSTLCDGIRFTWYYLLAQADEREGWVRVEESLVFFVQVVHSRSAFWKLARCIDVWLDVLFWQRGRIGQWERGEWVVLRMRIWEAIQVASCENDSVDREMPAVCQDDSVFRSARYARYGFQMARPGRAL